MDSIGYDRDVVFPVEIELRTPGSPAELVVDIEFGVCKEICIPVAGRLSVALPSTDATSGSLIAQHLARVPTRAVAGDPSITGLRVTTERSRRRLVGEAHFPGGSGDGDLFIEAPDGGFVPLTRIVRRDGNGVGFEVALDTVEDWNRLKGRALRATLVSAKGQCWSLVTVPAN
jgi:DsbC/DsbD-like thiol-disulfide interchange protein